MNDFQTNQLVRSPFIRGYVGRRKVWYRRYHMVPKIASIVSILQHANERATFFAGLILPSGSIECLLDSAKMEAIVSFFLYFGAEDILWWRLRSH